LEGLALEGARLPGLGLGPDVLDLGLDQLQEAVLVGVPAPVLRRLEVLQVVLEVHLAHRAVFVGGDRLLYVRFDHVALAQVLLFLHVSKPCFFDLGSVFLAVLHLRVCRDQVEVPVGTQMDFEDLETTVWPHPVKLVKHLFLMLLHRIRRFGLSQDIDLRDDKVA